jgi:hypothetical protein
MALSIVVDGVTLTHRVRLNDGTNNGIDGLTSAADGSGSMGGIIIDDPDHDLVLQGWQTVVIEESDCTTAPRLFTGFIGDRTTTHGNYPTDGGRQVNVTLYDQNVLLSWALITGADGKRPVESRTARITWLLGSDYLDTIVFDTGFVVPSGASDFDEADYRGQYPRDVLDDVLGAFQVAFAFWDEAADKIGLFYDAMTATTRDSTLTISNDPADQDFSTCWPPYVDAELGQDPSNVYSLERLTYTNGLLLREDPTTKAQFFPSPYPDRGQATDRSRIGKAVTADHYIDALLEQASAEDETVTCTLLLPSTHVGLVDAGQRISVKFVHLDGYEDFVYTRITSRTTRQALGRSDLYEVQLTLNQRGPFGGGGGGGGSNPPPTTFPPGPITPVHFYDGEFDIIGDTSWNANSDTSDPGGVVSSAATTTVLVADQVYDYVVDLEMLFGSASTGSIWLINDDLSSVFSVPLHFDNTTGSGPDFHNDAGTYHFTGTFTAPDAGHIKNPYRMRGLTAQFPHAHDVKGHVQFTIDPVGWDPGTPTELSPGQPNQRPEVVTMTGANGTTVWPFANGTLKVFVDDTDQTGAITAQDGAAGTFTLGFTPFVGEVVTVEYVGR